MVRIVRGLFGPLFESIKSLSSKLLSSSAKMIRNFITQFHYHSINYFRIKHTDKNANRDLWLILADDLEKCNSSVESLCCFLSKELAKSCDI